MGLWQGSTFCAALANNSLDLAVGVDDWSQFQGPKQQFEQHLGTCVGDNRDRVGQGLMNVCEHQ